MDIKLRVLILVIALIVFAGIYFGTTEANEQVEMTPEEFAREVCTTLKDKGLLKVEYNGVEYVCADFEE